MAGGLLVLWSPQLDGGFITLRVALAFVGLSAGLAFVVRSALAGDAPARWAGAFLVVSLAAALTSGQPRIAVLGSFGSDLGWIHLASWLAAWGLGRGLDAPGRRLLPAVLLAGVLANAAVAVLQALVEPNGALRLVEGRASGLAASSVFLAGLLSGGLAMAGRRYGGAPSRTVAPLVVLVLLVVAVDLTGSRAGLVGGSLVALAACHQAARVRARRLDLARLAAVIGALALGTLLAATMNADQNSTDRLANGGGFGPRLQMWGAGIDAAAERPLLGWGPGRFRAATAGRADQDFVRSEGPDRPFYDAHNLLIEHLVGGGILGLSLLVGFGWAATRQARGSLAWFAGGVALTWLFTPVSVVTAPVALLALGAAVVPAPAPAPALGARGGTAARGRLALAAVATVCCAVFAARIVWADALVARASIDADPEAIARAAALMPPDAILSDLEASAWRVVAVNGGGDAAGREALLAAQRAVELDPTRSTWWVNLGEVQMAYGADGSDQRLSLAETSFNAALERTPWSVSAMVGLGRIAELRGDHASADRWREQICSLVECPTAPSPG